MATLGSWIIVYGDQVNQKKMLNTAKVSVSIFKHYMYISLSTCAIKLKHHAKFELDHMRTYWNIHLGIFHSRLMLLWPWNVIKVPEGGNEWQKFSATTGQSLTFITFTILYMNWSMNLTETWDQTRSLKMWLWSSKVVWTGKAQWAQPPFTVNSYNIYSVQNNHVQCCQIYQWFC